jgi:hypothetical protein
MWMHPGRMCKCHVSDKKNLSKGYGKKLQKAMVEAGSRVSAFQFKAFFKSVLICGRGKTWVTFDHQ